MDDVAVEILDDPIEEIEDSPPKRKRGRPNGAKTKKAARAPSVLGNPRYKNYYTGHHNKAQTTQASWAWIDGLDDAEKGILDLTVYRDWPVLKMPLKPPEGTTRKNPKSIGEQIPGTNAFKTDQDLVDMFGAGDYRVYVNVNPEGGARRELFCNVVKGTHDFRAFPPTDWRIDNINEVDLNDPSNGTYVAWLKSQGKIPDDAATIKEKDEMSATAEVLGKVLDQNTAVMNRMLDEKDKQIAEVANDIPPEPPSQKEVLSDAVSMLRSVRELVPTADPMQMMQQVLATAQLLVQQKEPSSEIKPLMERIDRLQDQLRTTEVEGLRAQLTEIREQLKAKENPGPNVLLPDGTNVEKLITTVVERVMDKPEESPWLDIFKQALPVFGPVLNAFAQRLMMPAPQPQTPAFPMPPAQFQAGAPQPQAQLPAPAQPQQAAPQAQPQGGAYTTGNAPLDHLLMMIQVPLADHLRDGDSGELFAEYFISDFGIDTHTQLATFGPDAITNILYGYPPLGPILKPLKRETVNKFVSEFVNYKPQTDSAGGAA